MQGHRPNLFLLGAPKCGTTSLVKWLSAHPAIYFSPVKEPCHFNTDSRYMVVKDKAQYRALFKGATMQHSYVAEASVWYLYSSKAVPNILEYAPDARFLVCLRNPIDLAVSLHSQQIVSGEETELDFERAWRLQGERAKGRQVPRLCKEPANLLYGDVAKLGLQVQRLLQSVDRARLHFVFLDDLQKSPATEYASILQFLGLRLAELPQFDVENRRMQLRSVKANQALRMVSGWIRKFVSSTGTGTGRIIARYNSQLATRHPVRPELRRELAKYFADDVALLEKLCLRELNWLEFSTPSAVAQSERGS